MNRKRHSVPCAFVCTAFMLAFAAAGCSSGEDSDSPAASVTDTVSPHYFTVTGTLIGTTEEIGLGTKSGSYKKNVTVYTPGSTATGTVANIAWTDGTEYKVTVPCTKVNTKYTSASATTGEEKTLEPQDWTVKIAYRNGKYYVDKLKLLGESPLEVDVAPTEDTVYLKWEETETCYRADGSKEDTATEPENGTKYNYTVAVDLTLTRISVQTDAISGTWRGSVTGGPADDPYSIYFDLTLSDDYTWKTQGYEDGTFSAKSDEGSDSGTYTRIGNTLTLNGKVAEDVACTSGDGWNTMRVSGMGGGSSGSGTLSKR